MTSLPPASSSSEPERAAFTAAAAWFRQTVEHVGDRWQQPGLGEWTVRDLVGHASRSLVTVLEYLDATPAEVVVPTAAAYYAAIRDASRGPGVAERGRAAGRVLGDHPPRFLAELDERVQAKVAAAADDAFVATIAGGMRLIDYLPTRTFELVVHTGDLAAAIGVDTDPPGVAVTSALRLAADVAEQQGTALTVLLALTGRRSLPEGYSVV